MADDKLIYIGQKAFIDRNGEVLVLTDPDIGIDIPGGKIQEGETDIIAALKREVMEETSLEIEVGPVFYSWLFAFPPKPTRKVNEVYLVGFRCEYKKGDVRLSEEHANYRWVNKDNYQELNDGSPHFKALEKYFESR